MKLNEKFTLRTEMPLTGGVAGIWLVMKPKEVADAEQAGTGPGVPDPVTGTFAPGTIVAGYGVELDANGLAILGSSPNISSAFAKMFFVVFAGDNDYGGAFAGKIVGIHGGVRFDTEKYTAGSYVIGTPLILVSGVWQAKAAVGDHIQAVGIVGPRGLANGVLDVIMPQTLPTS